MYYGEKFNSISHLVGAVLALVGFGALLTVSIGHRSLLMVISFTVFGLTLINLYTMSTLYHSFRSPGPKKIFQKLDHVAIYLLIAGTYTPYMLISLPADGGYPLLAIIWLLAAVGVLIDTLNPHRVELLQLGIYLLMGWLCLLEYRDLRAALPTAGIVWLLVGGLSYSLGVLFYLLDSHKKLRHAHGVWHLFVLLGSTSHFVSVIGYLREPL